MTVNQNQKPSTFKYLLLLCSSIALVSISSCATRKDTEFIEVESRQVEKSLGIDKEKFNKFQVEEAPSVKSEEADKKASEPKEVKEAQQAASAKVNEDVPTSKIKEEPTTKIDGKKGPKDTVVQEVHHEEEEVEEGQTKEDESAGPYPEAYRAYDKVSQKIWPTSEPIIRIGERFVFQLTYLGLTAGHIQMETKKPVKVGGKEAYHFSGKLRSARYYSYIYTLDDSIDTFVTKENFLPLKYVLAQRESAQTVDDLQLFDHDELKTYHWYKKIKHGKLKEEEKTKYIPRYFQDSFSALLFVRTLPLKKGDHYEFPIVTRGKIWMLGIKVEETERIEIMDKDVLAIRINAETRFPGVLEKKGDILFWFSADDRKRLLKFEAQVKIGSVAGELVEYKDGEPL